MSNYPPNYPPGGQPPGNYPPGQPPGGGYPPPGYPGGPPPPGWQGSPPPGYYGQPPRKSNALMVGLIIGGVVLLIGVGLAVWFFIGRSGPATAAAKLMASTNPNLEVVSVDEGKETITFKDKSTGKVFTISVKDAEAGKISIKGKDGEEATIEAKDDDGGSISIKSKEGSVTFGSGSAANLPDWLPAYPGASMQGVYSTKSDEGEAAGFNFTTSDSVRQVVDFYESALEDAGMKVTTNDLNYGQGHSSQVIAVDSGEKRTAFVSATVEGGTTKVVMSYTLKR